MNLSELSIAELNELENQIRTEIKNREINGKKEALAEIRRIAQSHGFTLDDILSFASDKPQKERVAVKVKYRNPHQMDETWTGRGKRPKWIEKWLSSGGQLDELHVPAE